MQKLRQIGGTAMVTIMVDSKKQFELRQDLNTRQTMRLEVQTKKRVNACCKIFYPFLNQGFDNSILFSKMGHSHPLILYFRLFWILIVQLVVQILAMTGFEQRISGVRKCFKRMKPAVFINGPKNCKPQPWD